MSACPMLPLGLEGEGLRVTPLAPFGVLVEGRGPAPLGAVAPLATKERVVVLRGFDPPVASSGGKAATDAAFVALARQLGDPLLWRFGAVNELAPDDAAKNYLYTRRAVPFHWDGAFAGRVPNWILFHCERAPAASQGGETLFVDTTRVLARADEGTRERWRRARVTYSTERLVHYGGSFTSPVLGVHPVTGEAVLRFAEPVDDLNPVALDISGCDDGEALVADLSARLRDPAVCLAHRWEEGDLVLADNHALLHGRRASAAGAPRTLRRINVLAPSQRRLRDTLLDLVRIRRLEFLPAEIPIVAIPLLLVATTAPALAIAEAIAILVLLFHFGDMVNCLADRELDRVYKARLAHAVDSLGPRSVLAQLLASAAAALLLTVHLAVALGGAWILVAMVALGIALGAAYSVEPVRLKGRGASGTICVGLLLFVGPFGFLERVATGHGSAAVLALSIAYALLQMGVILVNTAEDHPEDLEAGVRTTIVALGLHRGIRAASVVTSLGGAGVLAVLAALYASRGIAGLAWLGLAPLAAGVAFAAWSVARLDREVACLPLAAATAAVKRAAPAVPLWIAITAWSACAAAAVLRLAQ